MIILGAGVNHWYHMDMNYRGMINMLVFCGCVGQSGGGWSHYVGQEKLRPQTGWLPLAFALDWNRPPRQMNSTSFFYNHASQWRYEKLTARELLSPLADASQFSGHLIDFNVRAERMGWLPSAPQLGVNPLTIKAQAAAAGLTPADYTARARSASPANSRITAKIIRVICLSGAPTCWALPARATSICSNICWAPTAVFRAMSWAPAMT